MQMRVSFHFHAYQPGDVILRKPGSPMSPPQFLERRSPVSLRMGDERIKGENWTGAMLRFYGAIWKLFSEMGSGSRESGAGRRVMHAMDNGTVTDPAPGTRYPEPGTRPPAPAPLRHIRCPRCKTRIPIYKEGPQEVTCQACGKKGPYTPKGVGTFAAASLPVPPPEPAPQPAPTYTEPNSPARMTRCSNCGSQVPIYTTVYPVRITCPSCGRSGMYKGPRTQ
jgi:ribosomal protein S27E